MDFNMNMKSLDSIAVDRKALATNYPFVVPDCTGAGAEVKTMLMNRFPLFTWLNGTQLSQAVRSRIGDNGLCMMHQDENGKWVIEVPRTVWTLPAQSTENECCWQPFDFAKCAGNVPVNLLCLKDCTPLLDSFIGRSLTVPTGLQDIASEGETMEAIRHRVARLSMAFLTAYTAILGVDNTYTDILKPFHGLLAVMENPAIVSIQGAAILSAFDSVACRLALLGDRGQFVFAVNPVVYESIKAEIRPGQFGELPIGWRYAGDELEFSGIRFIRDNLVPVDLESGTGEVWVLASDAVGINLATDLMPSDDFVKTAETLGTAPVDGCGQDCRYYYNFGAAFANNANRIMKIVNIPISGACAAAITDLGGLIMPNTLIPNTGE